MDDDDLIGRLVARQSRPSAWAVTAFLCSCAFAAAALLVLILSLH